MTRMLVAIAATTALLALTVAAPATGATKLVATVGPGFTITLKKAGKKVTSLRAGTYTITVQDKARSHNFHLKGPGVNKDSGVSRTGTMTWRVKLKRGKYTYVCDPHASSMRGTFTVK